MRVSGSWDSIAGQYLCLKVHCYCVYFDGLYIISLFARV